jgi:hypothetical protein
MAIAFVQRGIENISAIRVRRDNGTQQFICNTAENFLLVMNNLMKGYIL